MGLKGQWAVHAGIIPGQPIPEFTKVWRYTSHDDEADRNDNSGGSMAYHSRLAKMRAEAMDYYLQVSLPQLNNWATLEFIWF